MQLIRRSEFTTKRSDTGTKNTLEDKPIKPKTPSRYHHEYRSGVKFVLFIYFLILLQQQTVELNLFCLEFPTNSVQIWLKKGVYIFNNQVEVKNDRFEILNFSKCFFVCRCIQYGNLGVDTHK